MTINDLSNLYKYIKMRTPPNDHILVYFSQGFPETNLIFGKKHFIIQFHNC